MKKINFIILIIFTSLFYNQIITIVFAGNIVRGEPKVSIPPITPCDPGGCVPPSCARPSINCQSQTARCTPEENSCYQEWLAYEKKHNPLSRDN